MSDFQTKDGTGALFKAEKETEQHPDYSGNARVGGTDFWVSAWVKTSKKGTKYMSLSFSPKRAAREEKAKPAERFEDDKDIPF